MKEEGGSKNLTVGGIRKFATPWLSKAVSTTSQKPIDRSTLRKSKGFFVIVEAFIFVTLVLRCDSARLWFPTVIKVCKKGRHGCRAVKSFRTHFSSRRPSNFFCIAKATGRRRRIADGSACPWLGWARPLA